MVKTRNRVMFILTAVTATLSIVFVFAASFAEENWDTVTYTTYYPSPYGVYNNMEANRMAVGDTDGLNGLDPGDIPPADGQLYVARSVIYKPQTTSPNSSGVWAAMTSSKTGEMAYASDGNMYNYTGSMWVALGNGNQTKCLPKFVRLQGPVLNPGATGTDTTGNMSGKGYITGIYYYTQQGFISGILYLEQLSSFNITIDGVVSNSLFVPNHDFYLTYLMGVGVNPGIGVREQELPIYARFNQYFNVTANFSNPSGGTTAGAEVVIYYCAE